MIIRSSAEPSYSTHEQVKPVIILMPYFRYNLIVSKYGCVLYKVRASELKFCIRNLMHVFYVPTLSHPLSFGCYSISG